MDQYINCFILHIFVFLKGTLGLLEEQLYIKDALSRIVVEMAKREWPQQWPSMLSELDSIYSLGVSKMMNKFSQFVFCMCTLMD